ncbi:MAG: GFA family protein [Myxococcales bacterium]|nr:MAG: GFA family protein [Myxococcales bacterium]
MKEKWSGGCQCGAVRYEAEALGRASICHCRMCQRALGNAFAPFVTALALRWLTSEPKRFRSSNRVQRGFCPDCGTPLTYERDGAPAEITIATLDEPARVPPVIQVGLEGRLPWCDELNRLPTLTQQEAEAAAPFFASITSYQAPR